MSMVSLHAIDPSTVYMSAWARVHGMAVPDMERALRSLPHQDLQAVPSECRSGDALGSIKRKA
jgi:hypothetical protein